MRTAVRQNRNFIGKILRAECGIVNIVPYAEEGEVFVNMQMAIATDADMPPFPIARVAEDGCVLLIQPFCVCLEFNIGPLVVKSRGDDNGARAETLNLQRRSFLQRRGGCLQFKDAAVLRFCIRYPREFGNHAIANLDACLPRLRAEPEVDDGTAFHPLHECFGKVRANDAGKHRRILNFYGLGPVRAPATKTDFSGV